MGDIRTLMGDIRTLMGDIRTLMDDLRTLMGDIRTLMGDIRTLMGDMRTLMLTYNEEPDKLNHDVALCVVTSAYSPFCLLFTVNSCPKITHLFW
jgi:hypothetical protein